MHESAGTGETLEAVVLEEVGGILVDGVRYDEPGGDDLGGDDHALERLGKEEGPEATALKLVMQCQTGQENGRDTSWASVAKGSRELVLHKQMGGERRVGDDHTVAFVPDEGPPHAPRLGTPGVLGEPSIERTPAGQERVELVPVAKGPANQGHGYRRSISFTRLAFTPIDLLHPPRSGGQGGIGT